MLVAKYFITSPGDAKIDSNSGVKNEAVKQRDMPSKERQRQPITATTARSGFNIPTPKTMTNTEDSGCVYLPRKSNGSSPKPVSDTEIKPAVRTSKQSMELSAREARPSSGKSCRKRANSVQDTERSQYYSFETAEDDHFTFDFDRGSSGPLFSIQKARDVYSTVNTSENFMCIKTVFPAAENWRIKSGDVILEVNGRSIKGLSLPETEATLWAAEVHVTLLMCRPNLLMRRPSQQPPKPVITKTPECKIDLPTSKKKDSNSIDQTLNLTSTPHSEKQNGEKSESDVIEREHPKIAGSVTDNSYSDLLGKKPANPGERQKYLNKRGTIGEKQPEMIYKQEGEPNQHHNTNNTPFNPPDNISTSSDLADTANRPSDPADTNNTPTDPSKHRSTDREAQDSNHQSNPRNGRPASLAKHGDSDKNDDNVPREESVQQENELCNDENQLMAIPDLSNKQLALDPINLRTLIQQTRSHQMNITVNETTVLGNRNTVVQGNDNDIAIEVQKSIEASGKKMTDEHMDQVRQIGQKVKNSEANVTEAIGNKGAEIKANIKLEVHTLNTELGGKIEQSVGKVTGVIRKEGAELVETVTNTGQAISQRIEKITEDKYNNLAVNLRHLQQGMEEGNRRTMTKAFEAQRLKEDVEKSLSETSKKSSKEFSKIEREIRNTHQHLQESEIVGKAIKHDVEQNLKRFQQHIEESTKHAKTKAVETQKLKEDVETSLRKTSEKSSNEFSKLEREMRNSEQRLLETVEKEIKHLRKEVSTIRQSMTEELLELEKSVHDSKKETAEVIGFLQRSVDTLMNKQTSAAEEAEAFQQTLFAKLAELQKGIDLSKECHQASFDKLDHQVRQLETKVDKMDEGFGNTVMVINTIDSNGEIINRHFKWGRVSDNKLWEPWIY